MGASRHTPIVQRWDTHEIALRGTGRHVNPFREVDLTATFRHTASGATLEVPGFYDGEATWRVRFMPAELGEWTYRTRANDEGLDGHTGIISCVPPEAPNLHGPLQARGYHFAHADGARRYLLSTRVSCHFASPEVWRGVIDYLRPHHVNRVLFMMVGIAGTTVALFGKGEDGPDFWTYDLDHFRKIDAFVDTLRRADLLASPYFYYFNDKVQRGMSPAQDRAYLRYGMARLGAYANLLPCLSNEVEQKFTDRRDAHYDPRSHAWANEMGAYLKRLAVFGQAVTVHNPQETEFAVNPGFYTLLADWPFPWADYMMRQAQVGALGAATELRDDIPEQKVPVYNARAYARHNQLLIDLRRHGIPVINEEPGYEMDGWNWDGKQRSNRPWNSQTADTIISTFWSAATAGAYVMWGHPSTYELGDPLPGIKASRVPGYLNVLHDTVTSLPYETMAPANEVVSANEETIEGVAYRTNFCLARPGEAYLIYSLHGGPLTLDLPAGTAAAFRLTLVSPRTGERRALGSLTGQGQRVELPAGEQVLLCRREGD